jgi:hypothetical protein
MYIASVVLCQELDGPDIAPHTVAPNVSMTIDSPETAWTSLLLHVCNLETALKKLKNTPPTNFLSDLTGWCRM